MPDFAIGHASPIRWPNSAGSWARLPMWLPTTTFVFSGIARLPAAQAKRNQQAHTQASAPGPTRTCRFTRARPSPRSHAHPREAVRQTCCQNGQYAGHCVKFRQAALAPGFPLLHHVLAGSPAWRRHNAPARIRACPRHTEWQSPAIPGATGSCGCGSARCG